MSNTIEMITSIRINQRDNNEHRVSVMWIDPTTIENPVLELILGFQDASGTDHKMEFILYPAEIEFDIASKFEDIFDC